MKRPPDITATARALVAHCIATGCDESSESVIADALAGAVRCDSCAGTGKDMRGDTCQCGGSGDIRDMVTYLRQLLHRRELEVEGLRKGSETQTVSTVDPAEHDCMAMEESLASAREDMRTMEAREPTQDEGDRAAGGPPNYSRNECFVDLGGWTGRRCYECGRWVFGGPALCLACDQRQIAAINDYVSRLIGAERGLCRCCGRAHAIQHEDDCPVPHLIHLVTP